MGLRMKGSFPWLYNDADDVVGIRNENGKDHVFARVERDPITGAESLVSGDGNSVLPRPPAAAQCIRSGQSAVGWTLTNGGGATATMALTAAGSPFGRPALKITIPDDTGNVDLIADNLGLATFTAGRANLVHHVYVEDELGIKQWQAHAGGWIS